MSNLKEKISEEQKKMLLDYSSTGLLFSRLILEDLKSDFNIAYQKSLLTNKPNEAYQNSYENIGFIITIQDQIIERANAIEQKHKLMVKVNAQKDIELMKIREENKKLIQAINNLKRNIEL